MSSVLSNAVSGLQASQIAIRTTGNNISNANTAGYSRQNVNLNSRIEQQYGGSGFLGNGVDAGTVTRTVSDFVTTQLRLDTSTFNQLDKFNTNIGKVDNLFSDPSTGLVGSLQSFFSALQNASTDPANPAGRQLVVTQAQSLSTRFNNLQDRLNEIQTGVNQEISTVTQQMQSIAKTIADLNQAISGKRASTSGGEPNDLLDQRDEAIRKLSELASVQLVTQDSGDVNVFVGNGQPLVVGPNVSKFSVTTDGKITVMSANANADVTNDITGGQLGGLLQFKTDILNSAYNQLGRVSLAVSDTFNRLQAQGLDIHGQYGSPMFADINDIDVQRARVIHGSNASPQDRVLSVHIDDVTKVTDSDYKLSIAPGSLNYTITRLSDNTVSAQGVLTGTYPASISFDGVTVKLESGSFQGGDTFTLQPTHNASGDIQTQITNPDELAFAVPIRTGATPGNNGSGIVSPGEVLSLYDANNNLLPEFSTPGKLTPPVIIRFTSNTTYDVLDNTDPSHPVQLNPPMREQTFIPNRDNYIFASDVNETKIVGAGPRLGLPAGRAPATPVLSTTAAQTNGYPAEQYTFSIKDPNTGLISKQVVSTTANASAAQTAALLSSVPGFTARAFTTATLTDLHLDPTAYTAPLQLSINGENLLPYNGSALSSDVPDPSDGTVASELKFNDYVAQQINSNSNLSALGIRAESGSNPYTGAPELKLTAASGVNLDVRFTASNATNNSISVNDGSGNPNVRLVGADDGILPNIEQSQITVGGKIDLTLAGGVSMATAPSYSQLFGDSTLPGFAQSSFRGYQVKISGQPKAGDSFTLDFNSNPSNDNRNALSMAAYDTKASIQNGSMSFSDGYGRLVEEIGTKASLSKINTDASKSILQQTQSLRDGISGVNLDEEGANLIQYQQLYTANARVISIAKDLFDSLLSAVHA